jgi:hypothetical protein
VKGLFARVRISRRIAFHGFGFWHGEAYQPSDTLKKVGSPPVQKGHTSEEIYGGKDFLYLNQNNLLPFS